MGSGSASVTQKSAIIATTYKHLYICKNWSRNWILFLQRAEIFDNGNEAVAIIN